MSFRDAPGTPAVSPPAASVVPEAPPTAMTEACDVIASRDWEAWINKMPGPNVVPTAHVIGKVDVRTPGYTFEWAEGPMDRSAMPVLRLRLIARKADGMIAQIIATEEVKYQGPAPGTGISRVIIGCGSVTTGRSGPRS